MQTTDHAAKPARRAFNAYAGIQPDAFARAEMVDAELGWPDGLAIGRLAKLWMKTQSKDIAVDTASGALILKWAGVEPEFGQRFLGVCALEDVHFLEPVGAGRYFIVGNPQALERIEKQAQKSARGGFAKAAAAKQKKEDVLPEAVPQAYDRHASGVPEAVPEARLGHATTNATGLPGSCPRVVVVSKERERESSNTQTTTTRKNFPGLTPENLAAIWNETRGKLAGVRKLEGDRLELAESAVTAEPDTAYWREVVTKVAASDFCTGKVATARHPRGWKATFEWLLVDGNHVRVAEGEFDNPEGPPAVAAVAPPECLLCLDTGTLTASGPDEIAESFRCECAKGRAAKGNRPIWDEAMNGHVWRRWPKQLPSEGGRL